MSDAARKLVDAAMQLSAQEQMDVVESLLEGIDRETPSSIAPVLDPKWEQEIRKRMRDVEEGAATVPWETIRAELQEKSRRAKAGSIS